MKKHKIKTMIKEIKMPVVKDYKDLWDFTNEYKKITSNFPCLPSDFNYSYFSMSDITETIQALNNTVVDAYFGGEEDTVEEVLKLILRLAKLAIEFNKHFGT